MILIDKFFTWVWGALIHIITLVAIVALMIVIMILARELAIQFAARWMGL